MAYPTQEVVAVGQHAGGLHLAGIGGGNVPYLPVIAVDQFRSPGIGEEDVSVGGGDCRVAFPAFFKGMLPLYLLVSLSMITILFQPEPPNSNFFSLLLARGSGHQQQCGTEVCK